MREAQSSAGPIGRGRVPLRPFSAPRENEGSRAPTGAGADTPHPWRASRSRLSPDRRRRPAHDAGRARLSALCCGVLLTASGRAFVAGSVTVGFGVHSAFRARTSSKPGVPNGLRQPAPGGGIVVSPDGAPTPPECELARLTRGRRPSPRPGITGRRLPELGTASPVPTFRPAPRSRRLMSAPSSEQGVDYIPE
jgi:hypothetical protein